MAAANYHRPKPIDPLWYRLDCQMIVWCACGRREMERVRAFQERHQLSPNLRFYELAARLRCTACGGTPSLDVTR